MAAVKYTFNPFDIAGVEPPPKAGDRREAVQEISEFILERVLSDVESSKSPVSGARFTRLSKEYKKFKQSKGRGGSPNLEFKGDMLSALKTAVRGNKITLSTTGKQGSKADGHNNHSGQSSLPQRRYIPLESDGETFRGSILNGIRSIAKSFGS